MSVLKQLVKQALTKAATPMIGAGAPSVTPTSTPKPAMMSPAANKLPPLPGPAPMPGLGGAPGAPGAMGARGQAQKGMMTSIKSQAPGQPAINIQVKGPEDDQQQGQMGGGMGVMASEELSPYLSVIVKLADDGWLSEDGLQHVFDLMNDIEEYGRTLTKQAAFTKMALFGGGGGGFAGHMGEMLGGLKAGASKMIGSPMGEHLAVGGALAAGSAIASMMSRAMQSVQIHRSKDEMRKIFPELQGADSSQVDSIFDTVAQIAPHVAGVPRLVGTVVEGVLHTPGGTIGPDLAQSLMRMEEQLAGGGQPGLGGSMMEGAGRALGQSAVETALPSSSDQLAQQQMRHAPYRLGIDAIRGFGGLMQGAKSMMDMGGVHGAPANFMNGPPPQGPQRMQVQMMPTPGQGPGGPRGGGRGGGRGRGGQGGGP